MNNIYTRVSIRKYLDKPVETEKTEAILRAFAIFPYGYPAEERKQQDRFDESRIHYVK